MTARPAEAEHTDRARAEGLDAADPLAGYRSRFVVPDDDLVYRDGNSLGRRPAATAEVQAEVVAEQWAGRLIRSWEESWLALPSEVGDRLGTGLLGARPGETLVCDSVTLNLFKLLHAALDLRPGRGTIVAHRDEFPTDRYVATEIARRRGGQVTWIGPLDPDAPPAVEPVRAADLAPVLHDDVAVVLLSLVDYRSAAIADLETITAAVHRAGAVMLWDCSHAVGSIPIDLPAAGADLAVGCSYKYLDGGPGAPGWLWVDQGLHDRLGDPVIPGWLGHADAFAMGSAYQPAPGVRRFLTGTPSPLGLHAVDEGVRLLIEAGMPALRAKSRLLTSYAIELVDDRLAPLDVRLGSPRDPDRRGSHITVHHPEARALCQALVDGGVVPDFRTPDGIRLGLSPLTTRFTDVHDGIEAIRALLVALS
jgi:kynureninase